MKRLLTMLALAALFLGNGRSIRAQGRTHRFVPVTDAILQKPSPSDWLMWRRTPGKTGVVYTLDRQSGEFLWARPTVAQNVISGIDPNTGAVTVNEETLFTRITRVLSCARAAPAARTGPQARTAR